jgi:pilus assembly protein CpaB
VDATDPSPDPLDRSAAWAAPDPVRPAAGRRWAADDAAAPGLAPGRRWAADDAAAGFAPGESPAERSGWPPIAALAGEGPTVLRAPSTAAAPAPQEPVGPTAGLVTPSPWGAPPAGGAAAGARTAPGGGSVDLVTRTAGGVATWLPEGRWAEPDGGELPPAAEPTMRVGHGRVSEERRRRGRRRVAATRLAARLGGWPRRVLAVALLLAAVVVALRPDGPAGTLVPAPVGVPVVVTARDLPAGVVLTRSDLRVASLPAAAVPAGAARDLPPLLGRTVAGPVRRGETVTDARLVGPGLTTGLGPQESAAVPVRLADAEAAALVRPGDRVDVLGAPVDTDGTPGARDAVEVATGVRVLAVLRGHDATDGVVVVVATTAAVARRLAGAATRHRLTVTVQPP